AKRNNGCNHLQGHVFQLIKWERNIYLEVVPKSSDLQEIDKITLDENGNKISVKNFLRLFEQLVLIKDENDMIRKVEIRNTFGYFSIRIFYK
ncbi:MAG: hypothetical protein ABUT20_42410, partial [Bacteroidota bacterium]